LRSNELSRRRILCRKWFPREPVSEQTMAEAMYLEELHWEGMKQVVAAGIALALEGE
jgi:hypothetical protein